MINAKKDEICRLFRTASVVGSSGNYNINPDKARKPRARQENPTDQRGVLFDGMMDILSLPMTRARYFVARLVRGESALHTAASKGRTNLVKVLLDRGVNIDATEVGQWTALHYAAQHGHIEIVKLLLDRGASIDTTDDT